MKKNVLLLLVLAFQPVFSMEYVERGKPFQISRLSPEVKFRETFACTVREKLVASPSNLTVLALMEGRHISSSSLAWSSPVESASPCSKSPVSLTGFEAGSEPVLKPVSMMAGMRSYDSVQPSVSAVLTERKFAWSLFVRSMPASAEVTSAHLMRSDVARVSKVANSNMPGAFPMRRMSFSEDVETHCSEALDSDNEDVKTAKAAAAMMKLYF